MRITLSLFISSNKADMIQVRANSYIVKVMVRVDVPIAGEHLSFKTVHASLDAYGY